MKAEKADTKQLKHIKILEPDHPDSVKDSGFYSKSNGLKMGEIITKTKVFAS